MPDKPFSTGGVPDAIIFKAPKKGVVPDALNPAYADAPAQLLPSILKSPRFLTSIECPYSSTDTSMREKYLRYAKQCIRDSLKRREAPFSSVLMFSRILNDRIQTDYDTILACHVNWISNANLVAVYTDLGITTNMQISINVAMIKNRRIEYRSIGQVA